MVVKIKKIGKVAVPYHSDSDYGDSQDFFKGIAISLPYPGEVFTLMGIEGSRSIKTSLVQKVTNTTFETLNSVYSWEIINENQEK